LYGLHFNRVTAGLCISKPALYVDMSGNPLSLLWAWKRMPEIGTPGDALRPWYNGSSAKDVRRKTPVHFFCRDVCGTKKAATSRQRIITAFAKRIATDNPFDCEPAAFQGTVFFYRLQRIFTAGRCKPAAGRFQRRNENSVKAYERHEYSFHVNAPESRLFAIMPVSLFPLPHSLRR
jgi:hypothetical protein